MVSFVMCFFLNHNFKKIKAQQSTDELSAELEPPVSLATYSDAGFLLLRLSWNADLLYWPGCTMPPGGH